MNLIKISSTPNVTVITQFLGSLSIHLEKLSRVMEITFFKLQQNKSFDL